MRTPRARSPRHPARPALRRLGLPLVAVVTVLSGLGVLVGGAGPAGAVTPPHQGWTSTEAPLPADAGNSTAFDNVYLASSACPVANGCVTVGWYHDTGGKAWGLIETQSGTTWTDTEAPQPANSGSGTNQGFWLGSSQCGFFAPCRAVSCPSATACVAVGEYTDSAGFDQPVVDTLSGGTWTSAEGALPGDAATDSTVVHPFAYLYSVSCTSSTSCVAVGAYRNTSGDNAAFIATLSGTTWSAQPAPLPANAGTFGSLLTTVSCSSATLCAGGGYYRDNTSGEPFNGLLVTLANGVWTGIAAPQPAGAGNDADGHQSSFTSGVACPSAASCVATGGYEDASGDTRPLLDTWNGSGWTGLQAPVPADASSTPGFEQLVSVSCGSPTSCVTVGFYQDAGMKDWGLIDTLSNGTWSALKAPQPANSDASNQSVQLFELSCPTPSFCLTVGTYVATGDTTTAFVDMLSAGTWTSRSTPLPGNVTTTGSIVSQGRVVACNSPVACTLGGPYVDSNGNFQGYLDTYTGVQGYWLDATDGGIFTYGNAQFYGSTGSIHLNQPVVGMAATPDGGGYWLVASDGGIFSYGDAQFFGSRGGQPLNKPVVGMAATPDGMGYWLVASDGGIFSYGDAQFFGSRGGQPLNAPIVGMAASSDGNGYWFVASDGGIFNYGTGAAFFGSAGSIHLNKPVVGMAAAPNGLGYWLVASDGGIFNYGTGAAFYGSTGSIQLNKPVVGMASSPSGLGYWLVASDGGIFNYGDALFYGSAGSLVLNKPVVGMAG
jgi:hypothetical protein